MEFYVFCIFMMLTDPAEQQEVPAKVSKVAEEEVCC